MTAGCRPTPVVTLACTSCQHVYPLEPAAFGTGNTGCPRCGGWTWIVRLDHGDVDSVMLDRCASGECALCSTCVLRLPVEMVGLMARTRGTVPAVFATAVKCSRLWLRAHPLIAAAGVGGGR